MAPSAQPKGKAVKKPASNDNKTTTPAFIPSPSKRAHTPPPAPMPTAGTPIQPETSSAPPTNEASPPLQTVTFKTPIQKAQDALNSALSHLNESYQAARDKQKNGETTSKAVVETSFPTFEEIGTKVSNAIYYLTQQATQSEELAEHFSRLEKSLKDTVEKTVKDTVEKTVKDTIGATGRRTYAQTAEAAVTPPPPPTRTNSTEEIQQRNQKRKEEQRRKQNKLEVVLSTREMNPDMKEQIKQHTHSEITIKLQQNVESQVKDNSLTIKGVEKLKSKDIRICCNTEHEAEQLRQLKWDKAYGGLTVHQPKYGVMIPRVPTDLINTHELKNPEIEREIEHQNKENGNKIVGIKTLR